MKDDKMGKIKIITFNIMTLLINSSDKTQLMAGFKMAKNSMMNKKQKGGATKNKTGLNSKLPLTLWFDLTQ